MTDKPYIGDTHVPMPHHGDAFALTFVYQWMERFDLQLPVEARDQLIGYLSFATMKAEIKLMVERLGETPPDDAATRMLRSLQPGGMGLALMVLHEELDKRFPGAVSRFASDPSTPKYMAALDALIESHAVLARFIEAQFGVNKLDDDILENELTNAVYESAMVSTTDECRPLARKVLEALRK